MNNYKVYEQFFSKVVEDGNYRRRGKVFQTRNRFYYYDTGTGKVFECEKVVYEVLKKLQDTNEFGRLKELELSEKEIESALKQIMESVNNENILKAPLLETFSGEQVTDLKKSLENKLGQITFEVTQKCNLRCDYCIYQEENPKFRDFSQHGDMSFEIAKKVIDYSLDKLCLEIWINRSDWRNKINDPATNILGVQKIGNCIKVLVSGDELELFKEIAASLPAIYDQRGDTNDLDVKVLPQPNFIANYKYVFIAVILIIAMFMGCVFNAMNMVSEKEEGVVYINEILPMTKKQYMLQKIFIGFTFGCLSSILTVCFSLRLALKYIPVMLLLIVLSAFISALVGMLIGKWADGILIGITYVKISMIIFIAVPLISYLLHLGETTLGKLCYLVPSTATFEGIMGMVNGNTAEVGKSIAIMVLHSILWFVLFWAIERRQKKEDN